MKHNPDGETLRISPSEMKDADTCMRLYYYKYLKRLKLPKKYGIPFVLGVSLHAGLESIFSGTVPDEAWKLVLAKWDSMRAEAGEYWYKPEDFDGINEFEYKNRAQVLFRNIANAFLGNEVLGREERLGIPIDRYITLHGYADIRHRNTAKKMCLGDWKFGAKVKTAGDILEFWYQFVGYKFMAEHMFGESPDIFMHTGSVSVAAKPKQLCNYNILPVELPFDKMWKELCDRARYLVEYVILSADSEDMKQKYPQTGRCNGRCSYCEFIKLCSGLEPESNYISENKEIDLK